MKDDYSIVKLLGKGTYAKVYLVKDKETHKEWALKELYVKDFREVDKLF